VDFLYINIGKIPDYFRISLESIKISNPNSKVYLLTDDLTFKLEGLEILYLEDVIGLEAQKILDSNYFSNEKNPLWKTSMVRVFLLKDLAKYLNIDSFIHFDNDVLIYQNYENLKNLFDNDAGLNITRNDKKTLVFGFSYTSNIKKFDLICEHLFKILTDGILNNPEENTAYVDNEMHLLNNIYEQTNLISVLPSSPAQLRNEMNKKYIFDPSSYGQYLDGWHEDPGISTISLNQSISSLFLKNEIVINYQDVKPYFELNDQKYFLANLHIHSKNLSKFL
tara:strand:+ start:7004 stop:7843 length:840 start_codon:yes stop_codon:yes gene_type:complete